MKISIIIPVLGQQWYTDAILSDIPLKVKGQYEIILLDGSELGVNAKWNKGVQDAKGEYVWILNNDIILTEGLDAKLMELLETYKVVCPYSTTGKDKFCLPMRIGNKDNIAGWCFMMKREDWVPIDERLDLYYGDNWVYETQKHSVGYVGLCHHFESKTINSPEMKEQVRKRVNKDNYAWQIIKDEFNFN